MAFTRDSVTFTHFAKGHYRVEIREGDGSIVKRNLPEAEVPAFCEQHGFSQEQIADDLAVLRK